MFAGFFKDPYRIHACAAVVTQHQKEIYTRQLPITVVIDTKDSDSNDEDSVMNPLIHLEDSENKENIHGYSPSKPPTSDPTREPVNTSNIYTKEPTSEPNPGTSPDPSAHTRVDNKGHLAPGYIIKYQKGSYLHIFATLEKITKEPPWGDT